jgi:hypothetical protein
MREDFIFSVLSMQIQLAQVAQPASLAQKHRQIWGIGFRLSRRLLPRIKFWLIAA